MFGIANRRLRVDLEARDRFLKKLKKLVGNEIVIEWWEPSGERRMAKYFLYKISDNAECVHLRRGEKNYVERTKLIREYFIDSFSKKMKGGK